MTENSPLVFNYADIKAEDGLRVTLTPDPADYADLFDRPGTLKNLTLELEFTVGGNSILLAGSVTGELELECSRCAEPVTRSYRYARSNKGNRRSARAAKGVMFR